ncbi:MAG: HipA domain-containing protein, partial [Candidatus Methanomethylophilaceae archaeon]|nr:HipA domain-containing protein [Candidatus Methanomethylophilaceae archaeon]
SCFNILAKNFDDHSKNFAYLYSRDKGRYVLSPAYDLTRTPSMAEHFMTCMGNPLPGEKELFGLADASGIPRNRAEDIIRTVADNVSERLAEWL